MFLPVVKLRYAHRTLLETEQWADVPYNERICLSCRSFGDDFHYLLYLQYNFTVLKLKQTVLT